MMILHPDPFQLLNRVLREMRGDGLTTHTLMEIDAALQRPCPALLAELLDAIVNEAGTETGVLGETLHRVETMWAFHQRMERRIEPPHPPRHP